MNVCACIQVRVYLCFNVCVSIQVRVYVCVHIYQRVCMCGFNTTCMQFVHQVVEHVFKRLQRCVRSPSYQERLETFAAVCTFAKLSRTFANVCSGMCVRQVIKNVHKRLQRCERLPSYQARS